MRFLKNKVARALLRHQQSETLSEPDTHVHIQVAEAITKIENANLLTERVSHNFDKKSLLTRREVALPLIKFKQEENPTQTDAPFTAPVKREFRTSPFVSPQQILVKGVFNDFTIKTSPMTQTTHATSKGAFSDFSMKMSPFVSPHKAPKGVFSDFSMVSAAPTPSSTNKKPPQSNKNIVKNYARAMVNFALSSFAVPFLVKIVRKEGISLQEFKVFIQDQKEEINSIKTLRAMLLITEEEGQQTSAYKRVFRDICEIFIKFFAVNWIFDSKISDRLLHLKYRFKILRRVRNPEHFTYLENFNKTR